MPSTQPLTMSSSSSISLNSNRKGEIPTHCNCNPPLLLKQRTSWTRTNPARRFLTCPNSMCASKRCKAYRFIDDELTNEWYKLNLFDMYHYLTGDQREMFTESINNKERLANLNDEFEIYKSKREEEIGLLHMENEYSQGKLWLVEEMCNVFVVSCCPLVVCK